MHDKIECELKVASPESQYLALSYTWGDACITKPISVNGRRFEVTLNLDGALRHLRSPKRDVAIWVDAMCIKQLGSEEKKHQFPRLREIYSSAIGTFIWLGEGTQASDTAIDFFNSCGRANASTHALLEDYHSNRFEWWCLQNVINRAWFSRLWVIQEIIKGNSPLAVCGSRSIPFTVITRMLRLAVDHKLEIFTRSSFQSRNRESTYLLDYFMIHHEKRMEPGLAFWLFVFGVNHQCKDPRDRIFALSRASWR